MVQLIKSDFDQMQKAGLLPEGLAWTAAGGDTSETSKDVAFDQTQASTFLTNLAQEDKRHTGYLYDTNNTPFDRLGEVVLAKEQIDEIFKAIFEIEGIDSGFRQAGVTPNSADLAQQVMVAASLGQAKPQISLSNGSTIFSNSQKRILGASGLGFLSIQGNNYFLTPQFFQDFAQRHLSTVDGQQVLVKEGTGRAFLWDGDNDVSNGNSSNQFYLSPTQYTTLTTELVPATLGRTYPPLNMNVFDSLAFERRVLVWDPRDGGSIATRNLADAEYEFPRIYGANDNYQPIPPDQFEKLATYLSQGQAQTGNGVEVPFTRDDVYFYEGNFGYAGAPEKGRVHTTLPVIIVQKYRLRENLTGAHTGHTGGSPNWDHEFPLWIPENEVDEFLALIDAFEGEEDPANIAYTTEVKEEKGVRYRRFVAHITPEKQESARSALVQAVHMHRENRSPTSEDLDDVRVAHAFIQGALDEGLDREDLLDALEEYIEAYQYNEEFPMGEPPFLSTTFGQIFIAIFAGLVVGSGTVLGIAHSQDIRNITHNFGRRAGRFFRRMDTENLRRQERTRMAEQEAGAGVNPEDYVRNLTEEARNPGFRILSEGFDEEIGRMRAILGKQQSASPLLVGKAGVRKTETVRQFAHRLLTLDPNAVVLEVQLSNMVAGTTLRGMFEGRLQVVIDHVLGGARTDYGAQVSEILAALEVRALQQDDDGEKAREFLRGIRSRVEELARNGDGDAAQAARELLTALRRQERTLAENIVGQLRAGRTVYLFVDEIHTIMGAGSADKDSMDAANILKPYLADGRIRLIGASTDGEVIKLLKDRAMARRFEIIYLEEPEQEEVVRMMMDVKDAYEDPSQNIVFDRDQIEEIVRLSSENPEAIRTADGVNLADYMKKGQPAAARDLLDLVSSAARIRHEADPNFRITDGFIAEVAGRRGIEDLVRQQFGRLRAAEGELRDLERAQGDRPSGLDWEYRTSNRDYNAGYDDARLEFRTRGRVIEACINGETNWIRAERLWTIGHTKADRAVSGVEVYRGRGEAEAPASPFGQPQEAPINRGRPRGRQVVEDILVAEEEVARARTAGSESERFVDEHQVAQHGGIGETVDRLDLSEEDGKVWLIRNDEEDLRMRRQHPVWHVVDGENPKDFVRRMSEFWPRTEGENDRSYNRRVLQEAARMDALQRRFARGDRTVADQLHDHEEMLTQARLDREAYYGPENPAATGNAGAAGAGEGFPQGIRPALQRLFEMQWEFEARGLAPTVYREGGNQTSWDSMSVAAVQGLRDRVQKLNLSSLPQYTIDGLEQIRSMQAGETPQQYYDYLVSVHGRYTEALEERKARWEDAIEREGRRLMREGLEGVDAQDPDREVAKRDLEKNRETGGTRAVRSEEAEIPASVRRIATRSVYAANQNQVPLDVSGEPNSYREEIMDAAARQEALRAEKEWLLTDRRVPRGEEAGENHEFPESLRRQAEDKGYISMERRFQKRTVVLDVKDGVEIVTTNGRKYLSSDYANRIERANEGLEREITDIREAVGLMEELMILDAEIKAAQKGKKPLTESAKTQMRDTLGGKNLIQINKSSKSWEEVVRDQQAELERLKEQYRQIARVRTLVSDVAVVEAELVVLKGSGGYNPENILGDTEAAVRDKASKTNLFSQDDSLLAKKTDENIVDYTERLEGILRERTEEKNGVREVRRLWGEYLKLQRDYRARSQAPNEEGRWEVEDTNEELETLAREADLDEGPEQEGVREELKIPRRENGQFLDRYLEGLELTLFAAQRELEAAEKPWYDVFATHTETILGEIRTEEEEGKPQGKRKYDRAVHEARRLYDEAYAAWEQRRAAASSARRSFTEPEPEIPITLRRIIWRAVGNPTSDGPQGGGAPRQGTRGERPQLSVVGSTGAEEAEPDDVVTQKIETVEPVDCAGASSDRGTSNRRPETGGTGVELGVVRGFADPRSTIRDSRSETVLGSIGEVAYNLSEAENWARTTDLRKNVLFSILTEHGINKFMPEVWIVQAHENNPSYDSIMEEARAAGAIVLAYDRAEALDAEETVNFARRTIGSVIARTDVEPLLLKFVDTYDFTEFEAAEVLSDPVREVGFVQRLDMIRGERTEETRALPRSLEELCERLGIEENPVNPRSQAELFMEMSEKLALEPSEWADTVYERVVEAEALLEARYETSPGLRIHHAEMMLGTLDATFKGGTGEAMDMQMAISSVAARVSQAQRIEGEREVRVEETMRDVDRTLEARRREKEMRKELLRRR